MATHIEVTGKDGRKLIISLVDIIEVTGDASGCNLTINLHPDHVQLPIANTYANVKTALAPTVVA
jgi:hypothetical protein